MDSPRLPHRTLKPLSSTSSSSSSSSSSSKLPIKRKAYHFHSSAPFHPLAIPITTLNPDSKPSPFKFHRIWSESDEILFLQGLYDSSSAGFSFPRDMPVFYCQFSATLPQPYTKSQFSEKLRRLRRKFRVISSRLSRGHDPSRLSPHDRALFDISKKLWGAELPSVSPFSSDKKINADTGSKMRHDYAERIKLVGVKVAFSPVLPISSPNRDQSCSRSIKPIQLNDANVGKTSVDRDLVGATKGDSEWTKSAVAKSVMYAVNESLKEVERIHEREKLRTLSDWNFERRWKVQRVAELDVFAGRLRLVMENSVNKL